MTLQYCNFTSNSAKTNSGAIFARSTLERDDKISKAFKILNCNFASNSVPKYDAIFANVYNVDIEDSYFDNTQEVYVAVGSLKNINNALANVKLDNQFKATILTYKYSTFYDSGRIFVVRTVDENGLELDTYKIKLTVKVGSKTKTYTRSFGVDDDYLSFALSTLPVGKYTVKLSLVSKYYKADPVKAKITIKKAKTIVKALKVTAKYKKSKKFTIKVMDKWELPIKKLKLKVKVYTGKKAKSYTLKTNKKGKAFINTKKLKRGTHKVVISSKNKNYILSKKSKIIIK